MQKLIGLVRRCVEDYNMIDAGERIAVGVSGGKDSLALLVFLAELRKYNHKPFTLEAITIDMGLGMDYSGIQKLCQELDVPYTIETTESAPIIFEYRKEKNSINDSVRITIDYCRKNGIMTDYLTDNESEVINMFGFEWNEEDERKALIELGEERREQRGEQRSTINSIRNLMKNMHWSAEEAMAAIGIEQSQYKQYLALL